MIAAVVGPSAWRRALAAVVAVALLVVGIAHSWQHFDRMAPSIAWPANASSADDSSDASTDAVISFEDCHGCTMTAIPAIAAAILPVAMTTERPSVRPDASRPYPPLAETPPPILTI